MTNSTTSRLSYVELLDKYEMSAWAQEARAKGIRYPCSFINVHKLSSSALEAVERVAAWKLGAIGELL